MPALETDQALSITRGGTKYVAVGIAHETDEAGKGFGEGGYGEGTMQGSFRWIKSYHIGMAVESDSPRPTTAFKESSNTIKAHEIDSALSITRGPKTQEHDFALPITAILGSHGSAKIIAVGMASEADSAPSMTRRKIVKMTVVPSETDLAFGHRRIKKKTLSLPVSSSSALPVFFGRAFPVGLASEVDVSFSVTKRKALHLDIPVETDHAIGFSGGRFESVNPTTETDLAQAVTRKKIRGVGLASEVDAATPVTKKIIVHMGLASENDSVIELKRVRQRTLGLVTETDTARPVKKRKTKVIEQTMEIDESKSMREDRAHYPSRTRSGRIVGVEEE